MVEHPQQGAGSRRAEAGEGPVVVGVDGSPESLAALRWAADYAGRAGAPLHAVIAWEHGTGFGFQLSGGSLPEEARRTLERAVRKVLGAAAGGVALEVVEGRAEDVLVAASRDARLLVVGDRGYSSVAGLLIGHCGEACVRHAACTTVVVRGGR
jgi:nucleotide-binding universal stress UspA family protein